MNIKSSKKCSLDSFSGELHKEQEACLRDYELKHDDLDEGCLGYKDYFGDFDCEYGGGTPCDHCIFGYGFKHPVTGKNLREINP